jgi:hypothetical protein
MPKCMNCTRKVPPYFLREVAGKVVCELCLPLWKEHGHLSMVHATERLKAVTDEENPMAESKRHLVASINVFEIETADGGRDHLAEVQVDIGGLNVKYDATFDQIRDFFTKRREQKPGKVKLVS